MSARLNWILLVMFFQAASPAVPTAEFLLNKCSETYDKTYTSFITRSRSHIHDHMKFPGMTEEERDKFLDVEFRTDGNRIKIITYKWGGSLDANYQVKRIHTEREKYYHSTTYNGKKIYSYSKPFDRPARVRVSEENVKISVDMKLSRSDAVSIGFGYLIGDIDRFDRILKQADPNKMSVTEESLKGTIHFVIEAETKRGKYKIWLNPERGYHFTRAEVVRKAGDLHMGKHTVEPGTSKRSTMEITEFKEVDGLWVPVNIKSKMNDTLPDDGYLNQDYEIELLSIVINPDHDALNSFSFDEIEEGTKASVNGSRNSHIWNQGKLIPAGNTNSASLLGKALPELGEFGLQSASEAAAGKKVVVCFWDLNQRPSRNCILQLSKRAQELKAKDIVVVAVQVSKIEQEKLEEWIKENDVTFPVGMIEGDSDKTRFKWGVKSLPWLILTDKKHIVIVEGFSLDELDEKVKESRK